MLWSRQRSTMRPQQIELLALQIAARQSTLAALTLRRLTVPLSERSGIDVQIVRVEEDLAARQAERTALPDAEPIPPTVQQQLQLTSLQNELAQLQLQYQTLYLRKLGVTQNAI